MKKSVLLFIILFVLPVAFADFSVSVQPIKDRIGPDDKAIFYLTIQNAQTDDYTLEFTGVGLWDLYYTEPLSDYQTGINNVQNSYTTRIYLHPAKTTPYGGHTSKVTVKSKATGVSKDAEMIIYITSTSSQKEYLPNVKCSVRLLDKIDPRKLVNLTLQLTNLNARNISSLQIEFASNLIKNSPYQVIVGPNEKKEVTFPIQFDPLQLPQRDTLKTTVWVEQYSFVCNFQEFQIIDYTSDFIVTSDVKEAFLKHEEVKTYKNTGNARHMQRVLEPTPLLSALFTWSNPDPKEILAIDGTRYRAWEFTLEPGETAKIILYSNYRPIFHLFLALLLLMGLYYIFRTPLLIKKKAKNIETREGGVSEVKILLSVINRTSTAIENVTIHDEIPHLTEVIHEFGHGTMKPEKILKHVHGGTLLEWRIPELEAYEERLIVYKIKSNLRILGSFKLPPAIARYNTKAGKKVRVNSNRLLIGG